MLELKNTNFSYGEKQILNDFSLKVSGEKAVCLFGNSGCGKTTVMKLLAGIIKPQSGTVATEKKLSCVFQENRLIESATLKYNLKIVLSKEQYTYAKRLLCELDMENTLNMKVQSLSGGMKRRAEIIKAVAFSGDALLLDEAFNGLDEANKQKCAEIIKNDFLNKGKLVLIISHNKEDAHLLNADVINI